MSKKLFVLSVDAMVTEDVDAIREMPNFKKYFGGGSEFKDGMRTIYPSVTYPIHVSILTGCYAGTHGITSNFDFTTTNKDDNWLWFSDRVQVEDIFAVAKRAGLTTASVAWPVTGCNPNIDYVIDEYWMPEPGDTLESSFRRAGSNNQVIEILESHTDLLGEGWEKGGKKNFMQWPKIDDFWVACACDILRKYKTDVTFLHTGAFDGCRHKHGVFSSYLDQCRADLDRYIGQVGAVLEEIGVLNQTNLVMVSDHGQRDINRAINLNVKLADAGLIDVDEQGNITDWRAFCFSNAMSTSVYIKDPFDEQLVSRVYDELKALQEEGVFGIGRIYTAREAREEEHLYGGFSFVIESDGYTSFGDSAVRPLVQNFDASDYRFGRATHGYMPDYGPQPVFVAKGPDIKDGVSLGRGRVIDEAPTFAALLGLTMPHAEGKPVTEILR